MGVTSQDLQNLIIATLSKADPSALSGLQSNVPKYWVLWNRVGYMPELQYYYVRRESIRYLMGCLNTQTDYRRSQQNASRVSSSNSRQDSTMVANASETGSGVANRSMSSSYSDATNASGSGSSQMSRSAVQNMSASGSMSDTGSGANSANQNSSMSSSSVISALSSQSAASQRVSSREVSGFHRRVNNSDKESAGLGVGVNGTVTVSATGELEDGTIQDVQGGEGNSASQAKLHDERSGNLSQNSSQSSSSNFDANAISSETMSASGSSHMAASASQSYSMSGSGNGSMTSTGAGNSSLVASETRTSTQSGEAHSAMTASSTGNTTMERLHQKFLHLKELMDQTNLMIEWIEGQKLVSGYLFAGITAQYPEGLNADEANAYVVKTPLGLRKW